MFGWDSSVVVTVDVDTASVVVVVDEVVLDIVVVDVDDPSGLISGMLDGVAARSSSHGGSALAVVAAALEAAGSQV